MFFVFILCQKSINPKQYRKIKEIKEKEKIKDIFQNEIGIVDVITDKKEIVINPQGDVRRRITLEKEMAYIIGLDGEILAIGWR